MVNKMPPPPPPAPDIRQPPKGIRHSVSANDSWVSLARTLGIDPWDLIDFNFPGVKQVKASNRELATRYVNWYLSEYVGCTASSEGKNYAFSNGLANRGRGDYRGGVIFLPPGQVTAPTPPAPPTPPSCTVIQIPPISIALPMTAQVILASAQVQWPTQARCLDPTEVNTAQGIYGNSLVYDDIYVSDGVGAQGRPFTVALPIGGRWIVVLNMGSHAYANPNADRVTMIHELAHAWQSQHHSTAWRFMENCVKSQAAAEAATLYVAANNNTALRIVKSIVGGVLQPHLTLGPADAYSYVPGKSFGDYGGEQIAQQIEDFFNPPSPPRSRSLTAAERGQIATIAAHVRSIPARARDPENERGLSTVKYVHQNEPGVVWHD